tara:strand:- start:7136 stop:7483 length:348 start_codon:yes stop_codon:yes gene_type:complete
MKNLPQTQEPAEKLDTKTQQMINDAVADVKYHTRYRHAQWDQEKVETELNIFYKQLEALDEPKAAHLRIDEKKQLRAYFKNKIRQNLQRLSIFLQGPALTARAINCNVVEPQILN